MAKTESVITIDSFTMKFGDKEVIKSLSFDVKSGEVFGFLGSNGSGKTTTLRALLGLYEPTGGTLHIKGKPYKVDGEVRLGYLPEERGLYKKETVLDVMMYFGQLKGMTRQAARSFRRAICNGWILVTNSARKSTNYLAASNKKSSLA